MKPRATTKTINAYRYACTKGFMYRVSRLWSKENVTHHDYFSRVTASTVEPMIEARGTRRHPPVYFGGASPAAETARRSRRTCNCSGRNVAMRCGTASPRQSGTVAWAIEHGGPA